MKSIISFVSTVLFFIVIGFSFISSIDNFYSREKELYNNGICLNCGGKYNLVNSVMVNSHLEYVFQCDNCGAVIKIGQDSLR